ncbi:hypothetical protein [Nocardia cerradoensis]|uniref:Uncharacterized protein n=1 Tax=Nocardia cerradoensis TaxID=85688 RepID=A0A231GSU1_9NOCA|nr:hypothetical protein [Nocardia cerradoensis]NKY48021.1 hypothetical protein [Nocardia cerradoensis]OXR39686.1 hypothetical protein B7C42_08244 [Nocardia cerradoensis]
MDYARLGLEYVNALKWPFVACYLATLFRAPMKQVIERLRPKSVSYPGGKAEFYEERLEALSAPRPAHQDADANLAVNAQLETEAAVTPGAGVNIEITPARGVGSAPMPTVTVTASTEKSKRLLAAAAQLLREPTRSPQNTIAWAQKVLREQMRAEFGIRSWTDRQLLNAQQLAQAGVDSTLAAQTAEIYALGDGMSRDFQDDVPQSMAENYVEAVAAALTKLAADVDPGYVQHMSPN